MDVPAIVAASLLILCMVQVVFAEFAAIRLLLSMPLVAPVVRAVHLLVCMQLDVDVVSAL